MTKTISVRMAHADKSARFDRAANRRGFGAAGDEKLASPEDAERIVRDFVAEELRKTGADGLQGRAPTKPGGTDDMKAGTQDTAYVRRQQWNDAVFDKTGCDHGGRSTPDPAEPRHAQPPARENERRTRRKVGLPRGIRLGRGSVLAMLLALLVIWKPGLVLAVILGPVVLAVIAYLTVGHERVVEIGVERWRKFQACNPRRAESLRAKADALAVKWDIVLDHLPKSWADRLALPDLSGSNDTTLQDAPDPFERLAREARNG
jgi:hypothetical protein